MDVASEPRTCIGKRGSTATNSPGGRRLELKYEDNRIRKLLASEYYDFSETVLIESPFAETSREGHGIQQVSLALTPTNLIIALDVFKGEPPEVLCPRYVDPSIECFELLSIYPLEYVRLSVFRRRQQKTLKARFIDGRVKYYEFGRSRERRVHWKIWCDQVEKLLDKRMDRSSLSESTAASSSSTTTLYLISSEAELGNGRKCHCSDRTVFSGLGNRYGDPPVGAAPAWTRKDLYLGPSHDELINGLYIPIPVRLAGADLAQVQSELNDHSPSRKKHRTEASLGWSISSLKRKVHYGNSCFLCDASFHSDSSYANKSVVRGDSATGEKNGKVSRFGLGVPEKCNSVLILGPWRQGFLPPCNLLRIQGRDQGNLFTLMESAVSIWEAGARSRRRCLRRQRHLRRYALATAAHFHGALGPWSVQPGERSCIEASRSMSLVTVRRPPSDPELKLPLSRRQLTSSASYTSLQRDPTSNLPFPSQARLILFWTTDYWYRPRHAIHAYRQTSGVSSARQLRHHLDRLRVFRQEKEEEWRRTKSVSGRVKHSRSLGQNTERMIRLGEGPSNLLARIFAASACQRRPRKRENQSECRRTTAELRGLLRMEQRITVWDFDSTLLASQLTLIDRDLLARIPAEETRILASRKCCTSTPNLGVWVAFAHRISCLTSTELLSVRNLEMRTRLMARFINAANKCYVMGNFQSCRSILAGLQTPAIYRLRETWSHLRIHHATRYARMEKLSKIFKSAFSPTYRKAWLTTERNPPCMPYVADLFLRILKSRHVDYQSNPSQSDHSRNCSRVSLVRLETPTDTCPVSTERNHRREKCSQTQNIAKRIIAKTIHSFSLRQPKSPSRSRSSNGRHAKLNAKELQPRKIREEEEGETEQLVKSVEVTPTNIVDVAKWLLHCQKSSRGYDFPLHPIAHEFLLKTRYREDRENFILSLQLEPPRIA